MNVPELRTERLRLRMIDESDTEALIRVFSDPAMSRFFPTDLSHPENIRATIAKRLAFDGPDGMGHWVIELDDPGGGHTGAGSGGPGSGNGPDIGVDRAIGSDLGAAGAGGRSGGGGGVVIGIAHLRPSWELPGDVAEIGYSLDSSYGGKGFATEAAAAVVDYGLNTLGLPAVWALVHESNVASLKLAERVGFLNVGVEEYYGAPHRVLVALPTKHGRAHHIELWTADLARAEASFGWLLGELGWREFQRWPDGVSWKRGHTYLVVEQSPALSTGEHERTRPGLNHVAFHVDTRDRVDELVAEAGRHGWRSLFTERYPHAGGPDHFAAYLENEDSFEVELVANDHPKAGGSFPQVG
ncbi:Protein N-acetyltransferase, RimJ/RimL family [Amycolatopsis xylanica]|uniref:Protein N-acetyltransferase, RimJ/RimL family n=1 Tax=Amycolatopsis xylanica TaxID=589385 RepID=A0A1H3J9S3_9PSEU|nr:GNAT family N-acetyltransferase [Amycolatopsis xylanica]SDY35944.1 Protein N-acetyltransferase, RimJ/RimL family [Amycolatopsis xylanica]